MSVRFQEGQIVRKGDLLAEIDPRPFQAQLTQFEGQLARDQALLDNARVDLKRFQVLVDDRIPCHSSSWTPRRRWCTSSKAPSRTTRARSTPTKVQLAYCRITSPIAGRVGLRLVDPGNIVQTTDTSGLVIITQLQPITVIFTIPEDNIPTVLDSSSAGVRLAGRGLRPRATARSCRRARC